MTTIAWFPLLVVCVLTGVAGFCLAHHKQRPEKAKAWAVLCFLLPVALPFLSWGKAERRQPARRSWPSVLLIVIANCVVIGQLMVVGLVSMITGNLTGLPTCSSSHVLSYLVRNVQPLDRGSGIDMVRLHDAHEVFDASPDAHLYSRRLSDGPKRRCVASVTFSNGVENPLRYTVGEMSPERNALGLSAPPEEPNFLVVIRRTPVVLLGFPP